MYSWSCSWSKKKPISLHYPFHSDVPCARSGPGKHGLIFLGDGRLTHEFGVRSDCPSLYSDASPGLWNKNGAPLVPCDGIRSRGDLASSKNFCDVLVAINAT